MCNSETSVFGKSFESSTCRCTLRLCPDVKGPRSSRLHCLTVDSQVKWIDSGAVDPHCHGLG